MNKQQQLETVKTDFYNKFSVSQTGELYAIKSNDPDLNVDKKDLTISQVLDMVFNYIKTGEI